MSVQVFFAFSSGLAVTLKVPTGTKQALLTHVEEVEAILGLKRSKYKDNPVHWDHWDPEYRAGFPKVDDELLCKTVGSHNDWVRHTYRKFGEWSAHPVEGGEEITSEEAALFWHAFQELSVAPRRWTADYYRSRMESLYEVMRGRESEGVSFDVKALTPAQASAVIRIFEPFLDSHDLRLEAPHGHDYLASSYDGGYSWCDKCFRAMTPDDGACCPRRKCPLADQ